MISAAGLAALAWAWYLAVNFAYVRWCDTKDFFDVLRRYKKEQREKAVLLRAQREFAEAKKEDQRAGRFMGRPE